MVDFHESLASWKLVRLLYHQYYSVEDVIPTQLFGESLRCVLKLLLVITDLWKEVIVWPALRG